VNALLREASRVGDGWDHEQLLAALRESMRARQAVPDSFVEMGKNAYAWHTIDADLAQLTCHCVGDRRQAGVTRPEMASIRALTLTSPHLSLELEVMDGSLLGTIVPPGTRTLEIHARAGTITTTEVDEAGSFAVDPIPGSPFRLRCRTADGADVLTGWIIV
jgi:hypothetical protein